MAFVDTGIREGHSAERKNEIACRATEAICERAEIPNDGVWVAFESARLPEWNASGSLVDKPRK